MGKPLRYTFWLLIDILFKCSCVIIKYIINETTSLWITIPSTEYGCSYKLYYDDTIRYKLII